MIREIKKALKMKNTPPKFKQKHTVKSLHEHLQEHYGYTKSLTATYNAAARAGIYKSRRGLSVSPQEAVKRDQ